LYNIFFLCFYIIHCIEYCWIECVSLLCFIYIYIYIYIYKGHKVWWRNSSRKRRILNIDTCFYNISYFINTTNKHKLKSRIFRKVKQFFINDIECDHPIATNNYKYTDNSTTRRVIQIEKQRPVSKTIRNQNERILQTIRETGTTDTATEKLNKYKQIRDRWSLYRKYTSCHDGN
jgi:hypothetical protein